MRELNDAAIKAELDEIAARIDTILSMIEQTLPTEETKTDDEET